MKTPMMKAAKTGNASAVLEIYDLIGPSWMGMIDAKSVSNELAALGDVRRLDVRISSGGGSSFEGLAIYNILAQHGAEIHVRVDGVAASAASLVLMAGKTRRIPKNAMVMVHDPVVGVYGGEKEMLAGLATLKTVKKAAISTYAAVTGQPENAIAQMMADETWMTGDEAVSKGFATTVEPELALPAVVVPSMSAVPPFFTKTPADFNRLVAMRATTATSQPFEPPRQSPHQRYDAMVAKLYAGEDVPNAERHSVMTAAGKTPADLTGDLMALLEAPTESIGPNRLDEITQRRINCDMTTAALARYRD